MMAVKKPFGIRVDETISAKFKALSTVLDVDAAILLEEMVKAQEERLNTDQLEAYKALLKAWKIKEE